MDAIISFIKKTGLQLNIIIVCSWFFKILFISIMIVTPFFFVLRLAGFDGIGIYHWLLLLSVGGMTGLIIGFGRTTNLKTASKWLDDNYAKNDEFSSALYCLEEKRNGLFDGFIIDNAFVMITKGIKVKFPVKYLLYRMIYFAAAFITAFIILQLANPFFKNEKPGNDSSTASGIDEKGDPFEENRNSFFDKQESSGDLAKMLFPEDKKMSELAEKAVRTGDVNMLNELMRKESMKTDEMIKNAKSQNEKDRLEKKKEKQQELAKSINERQNKNAQNQVQQKKQEIFADNNEEKPRENNKDDKENKMKSSGQRESGNSGKEENEGANEENNGGLKSGTEQSDKGISDNRNTGELDPEKNGAELMLTQKKDSPEFEFLLPDKKTKVSLKDVIPDSKKSAESAITRKGVPVEYEDFVRSYFISLLDEMKKSNKGDEK